jgi:hypothetical protein
MGVHVRIRLHTKKKETNHNQKFTVPETWTLRAVDQKHLESFQMWYWRRMEKISRTDHVRNEEVSLRVKEQRNILHEISKRKANWIGHILHKTCLLQ